MSGPSMRRFWDARAEEDPYYFADNRMRYRDPDLASFWSGGAQLVDDVFDLLGVEIHSSDEIVEIGCGVGRLTRTLAGRGASVRAIDVSEAMLDRARELNDSLENVRWILGDGESLAAIESGSADVCVSYVVFQHIPDPAITLRYVSEMGRVLRPGGWAAFQVSNLGPVHERRPLPARLRTALRALLGRGPRGQDDPAWRGSSVDLERLRDVASAAGMGTDRIIGAGEQHCLVLLRRDPRGSEIRAE